MHWPCISPQTLLQMPGPSGLLPTLFLSVPIYNCLLWRNPQSARVPFPQYLSPRRFFLRSHSLLSHTVCVSLYMLRVFGQFTTPITGLPSITKYAQPPIWSTTSGLASTRTLIFASSWSSHASSQLRLHVMAHKFHAPVELGLYKVNPKQET